MALPSLQDVLFHERERFDLNDANALARNKKLQAYISLLVGAAGTVFKGWTGSVSGLDFTLDAGDSVAVDANGALVARSAGLTVSVAASSRVYIHAYENETDTDSDARRFIDDSTDPAVEYGDTVFTRRSYVGGLYIKEVPGAGTPTLAGFDATRNFGGTIGIKPLIPIAMFETDGSGITGPYIDARKMFAINGNAPVNPDPSELPHTFGSAPERGITDIRSAFKALASVVRSIGAVTGADWWNPVTTLQEVLNARTRFFGGGTAASLTTRIGDDLNAMSWRTLGMEPGCRLSLHSGPWSDLDDDTEGNTLYLLPYKSQLMPMPIGVSNFFYRWIPQTGLSLDCAGLDADATYDVFFHATAPVSIASLEKLYVRKWATANETRGYHIRTAPSAGGASPFFVNNDDFSGDGGPQQGMGVYLGTINTKAGGNRLTDTAYRRDVFNFFNRLPRRWQSPGGGINDAQYTITAVGDDDTWILTYTGLGNEGLDVRCAGGGSEEAGSVFSGPYVEANVSVNGGFSPTGSSAYNSARLGVVRSTAMGAFLLESARVGMVGNGGSPMLRHACVVSGHLRLKGGLYRIAGNTGAVAEAVFNFGAHAIDGTIWC